MTRDLCVDIVVGEELMDRLDHEQLQDAVGDDAVEKATPGHRDSRRLLLRIHLRSVVLKFSASLTLGWRITFIPKRCGALRSIGLQGFGQPTRGFRRCLWRLCNISIEAGTLGQLRHRGRRGEQLVRGGLAEELHKGADYLGPVLVAEFGDILQDQLLQAVAPNASNGVILLTNAQSKQLEEAAQHVLQRVKVVREESDHVPEGLNHGGRQPNREIFVVGDLGHFRLGLQDHKDRAKQLAPEDVPEVSWEIAAMPNKGIEEVGKCPGLKLVVHCLLRATEIEVHTEIELPSHPQSSAHPETQ